MAPSHMDRNTAEMVSGLMHTPDSPGHSAGPGKLVKSVHMGQKGQEAGWWGWITSYPDLVNMPCPLPVLKCIPAK